MATVRVAVRVRPFNQREIDMGCQRIIEMEKKKTSIINIKIPQTAQEGDLGRERTKEFSFDYSYWSLDSRDDRFVPQEQVFLDLGTDVVDSAFEGYNACVFAYGQTGSGKTYTMMGSPDSVGLIPRICQSLFERMKKEKSTGTTYRVEVSYLEIYNEKVKDLLRQGPSQHSLRVREHPQLGPYVQDLSKHLVMDYADVHELMTRGSSNRTTAATNMNDVSSRSHAIFTITFVQAKFSQDLPSETVSKVNLVDLAGSERADATGTSGQRLKEGGHINKSLVTLGSVISALADMSSVSNKGRQIFIPYRDSTLTWLLKDSLGGNSKTIMIATISPAESNYGETLSTLRYANRAKNIVNRPTINEDGNVKLIRELRAEIQKLRALVGNNQNSNNSPAVVEKLQMNEARVRALTEEWTERWRETQKILQEQKTLALRKSGIGVVLDSDRPHLVGIDDSISSGITLYHLQEGQTCIGSSCSSHSEAIEVAGPDIEFEHCTVKLMDGVATLFPINGAPCYVDSILIEQPQRLSHGCVIMLGKTNVFMYKDPAEAARLRNEKKKGSHLNLSRLSFLSWSSPDLIKSVETQNSKRQVEDPLPSRKLTDQEMKHFLIMQEKSEAMKQEAEEAQQRMKEEQDRLTIQQNHIEQQRQRFQEEKGQLLERLQLDGVTQEEKNRVPHAMLDEGNQSASIPIQLSERETTKLKNSEAEALQVAGLVAICKDGVPQSHAHKNDLREESLNIQVFESQGRDKELEVESTHSKNFNDTKNLDQLSSYSISPNVGLENNSVGCSNCVNLASCNSIPMPHESSAGIHTTRSAMLNLRTDESKIPEISQASPLNSSPSLNISNLPDTVLPLNSPTSSVFDVTAVEKSFQDTVASAEAGSVTGEKQNPHNYTHAGVYSRTLPKIVEPSASESDVHLEKRILEIKCMEEESERLKKELEVLRRERLQEYQLKEAETLKLQELDGNEDRIRDLVENEVCRRLQQERILAEQNRTVLSRSQSSIGVFTQPSNLLDSRYASLRSLGSVSSSSQYWCRSGSKSFTNPADEIHPGVFLSIPSFVIRGTGSSSHYEFEVKIAVLDESWTIFRRYSRFRDLHNSLKVKFGNKLDALYFPPRRILGGRSSNIASERRCHLEKYLRDLISLLLTVGHIPLSVSDGSFSKQTLCDFNPFFRKGLFEISKHGTC